MSEQPHTGKLNQADAHSFFHNEFATLSLMAGLGTRNAAATVYTANATAADRDAIKRSLRDALLLLGQQYRAGNVKEAEHVGNIRQFPAGLPAALAHKLSGVRLRFGVAQKVVNLYLKYMWVAGHIGKPPHCPIDGLIAQKARINYRWTTSNSEADYLQAVAALRARAAGQELADWELAEFEKVRISATQKQG